MEWPQISPLKFCLWTSSAARTLWRAAARDVCSARMAPLTMFQKACTAVATAGGAGGAVFAYAVKRVTEDAEFRAWLREASPMASEQVNEFMAEYMPQTVTAIRVEEDMGEPEPSALDGGGVALRRSSRLDSPLDVGINLGSPPPLPRVSDAAKAIFGQLEPKLEPTEAEAATAAAAVGAAAVGAHLQASGGASGGASGVAPPSAVGVAMPQHALRPVEHAGEVAGEIAPDEPEADAPAS